MTKKKKQTKKREHPLFDYSYEDEVTFECPVRGTVTQKVLVKRYKSKYQERRERMYGGDDELEQLLGDEGFSIDEEESGEDVE